MDTRTRQVPLPTQSSSSDTTTTAKDPNDSSTLPTFVSRGLQTDFEVESTNLLAPMQFYEKQQSHVFRFFCKLLYHRFCLYLLSTDSIQVIKVSIIFHLIILQINPFYHLLKKHPYGIIIIILRCPIHLLFFLINHNQCHHPY